jgi:hypothetical protein
MAWLRIDDGFPSHPKFSGWTRAQKWALLELFVYCAKHKTGGIVPADMELLPRAVTPALIESAVESGFIDDEDGVHVIHDWNYYNPSDSTGAQRQERFRARNRNARTVTKTVTPTVTEPSRTRTRDPVPSPNAVTTDVVTAGERPRNELWDALTTVFGEASTATAKSLRGKLVRSLAQAGATPDEVLSRARSWPSHFDTATLTETALEKHWDALGRKPLRMAR